MMYQALTIAGSDSGGGAGIQADLKTFGLCGVFGTSVITAVTAQNTQGVFDIHQIPPSTIISQLSAIVDDFSIKACKIGMLGDVASIQAVHDFLSVHRSQIGRLVIDPVMIAKGGAKLLQQNAIDALTALLPLADVITPNIPEAQVLTGMQMMCDDDIVQALHRFGQMGVSGVIIKGGHRHDGLCRDWVRLGDEIFCVDANRCAVKNTHGTGCTFSACLTAQLAKGVPMTTAIRRAKSFITHAIKTPIKIGQGIGPVNHWAGAEALNKMGGEHGDAI